MVDSSNSRIDDQEEQKGSPTKTEKNHNQIIRDSGYFLSDREEASAFNFDKATKGVNNDDSHDKGRKSMQEADPPGT